MHLSVPHLGIRIPRPLFNMSSASAPDLSALPSSNLTQKMVSDRAKEREFYRYSKYFSSYGSLLHMANARSADTTTSLNVLSRTLLLHNQHVLRRPQSFRALLWPK